MLVIIVLGILAGGFAYSMRVETKLAANTRFETDLEWLGRSGVEFARYVLVQHMNVPHEPWDSLNQKWAGGPLGTNEALASISLENNTLGLGTFSVKIIDLERRFNINTIGEGNTYVLRQALASCGVNPEEISVITDSFLDWIDINEQPHLSGTESNDYISNPNPGFAPYVAKNGPIDDLAEMLLIRGVTPEIYWGAAGRNQMPSFGSTSSSGFAREPATGGLASLFTTISSGRININTAPPQVLLLVPGLDPALVQGIITARAGLDGLEGTEDDVHFQNPGELVNVPGMTPQFVAQLQNIFTTRSFTFEVHVEAKIDHYKRRFVALLIRNQGNPRDVQTLSFRWE